MLSIRMTVTSSEIAPFWEPPSACDGPGIGSLEIILQVSADEDAIRRRSESSDAIGVFFALHEEAAGIRERILQKGGQKKTERAEITLVSCKRSIGNASTHEKHRDVSAARFAQKVRPDFGLENQNERG